MVIVLLVAVVLVGWFVMNGRFNEATITLLSTLCLLLVGITDLLGELIMLATRKAQPPGA
jgi:uncharacterized Tic20 family protein